MHTRIPRTPHTNVNVNKIIWVVIMDNDKQFPQRKQLRLKNFDYSTPGAYFVTICTHNRKCILSRIVREIGESTEIQLTEYGKIVDRLINTVPLPYRVTIDRYVIMPNHIHLIIMVGDRGETRAIPKSPLQIRRSVISKIIGYIKMNASKEIHNTYGKIPVWQRGYHDHIIRNRDEYKKISRYIYENPIIWKYDCFFAEKQV